jgi:radical SAM family uncharacterized protein/radical SAM-linked protein
MFADFSIVLCFPDLYEIGASNLGLEILYHLINEKNLARCERVFAPDDDMELLLRKKKINLFSLESNSELKSFDILGFTIQCELVATNIVNILNLSDISIFSKDRKNDEPLVIAGGPALTNPEPFSDFFDLFVLGDGEEVIEEIIKIHKKSKKNKLSRFEALKNLSKVCGVYIPSFYNVEYNSDNTIKSVVPLFKYVKTVVRKRISNLDVAYFPDKKIVPFVETIHNRLNIEVARGCPGRCRFCQAAKYYYPWRQKSADKLIDLVKKGINSTGFEEIAFSSLSCSDYKHLDKLLIETNKLYSKTGIDISLPSLRCEDKSLKILRYINKIKKPTLTFAPEAGTDKLRCVIGKYITEDQIVKTLLSANAMGWKAIKLYFMIGLPTETNEDISGIEHLVKFVKKKSKDLNFNITISPFVPKAHTPFQWVRMEDICKLEEKILLLNNKLLPIKIKAHNCRSSVLEALIAKGDRKISSLIYRAWQKGARFDQWNDKFHSNIWDDAISECKVDLNFYIHRNVKYDEVLPWEHLNFGLTKEVLYAEYIKAMNESSFNSKTHSSNNFTVGNISKNVSCVENFNRVFYTDQFCNQQNLLIKCKDSNAKVEDLSVLPIMRLRLCFSKKGIVRFISHLQQIEVFRRAARRSGLPIAFTKGFSPKVKSSYGPPLPVGQESLSEYMELYFTHRVSIENVKLKFLNVLPKGFKLIDIKKVPLNFPTIDVLSNVSEYEIKNINISQEIINKFLLQKIILVEKIKKDKIIKIDIKPLIIFFKSESNILRLKLRTNVGKTINPEVILKKLLLNQKIYNKRMYIVRRTNLYVEIKNGKIYKL